MRSGYNCPPNYNPRQMAKFCLKCRAQGVHHPFDCPKYELYSDKVCYHCGEGHHRSQDCLKNKQSKN